MRPADRRELPTPHRPTVSASRRVNVLIECGICYRASFRSRIVSLVPPTAMFLNSSCGVWFEELAPVEGHDERARVGPLSAWQEHQETPPVRCDVVLMKVRKKCQGRSEQLPRRADHGFCSSAHFDAHHVHVGSEVEQLLTTMTPAGRPAFGNDTRHAVLWPGLHVDRRWSIPLSAVRQPPAICRESRVAV